MPSTKVKCPSDTALAEIGQRMTWTQHAPRKRKVEGTLVAVEQTPGTMETGDGTFLCVRLGLRTDDGKLVWTNSFADPGAPVGGEGVKTDEG